MVSYYKYVILFFVMNHLEKTGYLLGTFIFTSVSALATAPQKSGKTVACV